MGGPHFTHSKTSKWVNSKKMSESAKRAGPIHLLKKNYENKPQEGMKIRLTKKRKIKGEVGKRPRTTGSLRGGRRKGG